MKKNYHEIVVCGAGMVGMTFALLMSQRNINVCLIEKNAKNKLYTIKDSRTTAVSQGSSRIFEKLGIWNFLEKEAQPIYKILVSDGHENANLTFNSKKVNEGPLGFIIDNSFLKRVLLEKVLKSKMISFYDGLEVKDIVNSDLNDSFIQTNKGSLHYNLLVGADGRFSNIRKYGNMKYYFHDYNQTAFVFNINHDKPHRGVAVEKFFSTGPLALLPIKESKRNRSSVVWTIESKTAEKLVSKKQLLEEFEKYYKNFFGEILAISEIKRYPLNIFSCYDYYKKNVILIGDACQAIHPIAGQGFNLGLRDAECLATVIEEFRNVGLEAFSHNLLKKYEGKRILDKNILINATHGLNWLFSNNNNIIKIFRKAGLKIFSKSNYLKNHSMVFAMGLKNFEI